jgi:hypothetical protein
MTTHDGLDTRAPITEIVHAWLEPTTAPFPQHLRSLVLQEAARTPQRGRRMARLAWPTPLRITSVAAIGVLAVVGVAAALVLVPEPHQAISPGAATPRPSAAETPPGEEIEPGVVKVSGDIGLATLGPDGRMWHGDRDDAGASGLRPLGEDATARVLPLPDGTWRVSFGPGGDAWALSGVGLVRWDGERWQVAPGTRDPAATAKDLFVLDDGSALVAWLTPTGTRSSTPLEGAHVALERTITDGRPRSRASDDLVLSSAGRADQHGRSKQWVDFAITPSREVVAALPFGASDPSGASGRLWRWDTRTWHVVDLPDTEYGVRPWGVAAGDDGTLWVYLSVLPPERSADRALARLRDGAWTVWSDEDGVPRANETELADDMTVDRAGTLWLPIFDGGGCAGLSAFDSTAWRTYLHGYCVTEAVPAPDGMVWASARSEESQEGGLFRIDP